MKRFISIILVGILIFSMSIVAYADDDMLNYRWCDVEKIIQDSFGSNGSIWSIDEVNATMWLPGDFTSVDPSAEGFGDDCIDLFVSQSGGGYILITYSDSNGVDLDNYYLYSLDQQGVESYKILINDIPVVEQDREDSFMLTFLTQEGRLLQFLFAPASNPVYGLVMSSIDSIIDEESVTNEDDVEVVESVVPVNPVSSLISK